MRSSGPNGVPRGGSSSVTSVPRADQDLVRAAAGGDREAFAEFLNLHYDRIFRLCFRLTGRREEAEDLTQDICLALPRKLKSFRGQASVTTWLYRIAVNAAHDRRRRAASRTRAAGGMGGLGSEPASCGNGYSGESGLAAAVDEFTARGPSRHGGAHDRWRDDPCRSRRGARNLRRHRELAAVGGPQTVAGHVARGNRTMTDPLDDLKGAFECATPEPDTERRKANLARAQELFDRNQVSEAERRRTDDRTNTWAAIEQGVRHMLNAADFPTCPGRGRCCGCGWADCSPGDRHAERKPAIQHRRRGRRRCARARRHTGRRP